MYQSYNSFGDKAQSLGCQVHPGFRKNLREASGRESSRRGAQPRMN